MKLYSKIDVLKLIYQNKDKFYVYGLWRNDKQELFYIGKGQKYRIFEHLGKGNIGINPHKDRIIQKVGKDNIQFFIRFCDSEEIAFEYEIDLIKRYRKQLCNLTDGGEGSSGLIYSEEAKKKASKLLKEIYNSPKGDQIKKKISNTLKERYNSLLGIETKKILSDLAKGKPKSEEMKKKLSMSKIGHIVLEETKEKIRQKRKLQIMKPESIMRAALANKGRKRTLEQKQKISNGKKGKPLSEKQIFQYKNVNKYRKYTSHSEETKRKMSESQKRRKPITEETRQKMIESWKKRKLCINTPKSVGP